MFLQGVSEGVGIYFKNFPRYLPQHKLLSAIIIQNAPIFPKYIVKVILISCSGI